MKVSDIIQRKFLSFEADDTLSFAVSKLAQAGVAEAPVIRLRKYVGMFSASDAARVLVKIGVFGPHKADFSKARKDPVLRHMHPLSPTLGMDADIMSAYLVLLHRNVDVIPVVGKNRALLGVVLSSDLRKQMAQMLSDEDKAPPRAAAPSDSDVKLGSGDTVLDLILHFVQKKGVTTAEEVSAKFKIPVNEIEEYAMSLDKHGLLKAEYNFLGKMKLKKLE